MPDAVDTVTRVPDDGWRYHSKHVERFTDINKLYIVASCWTIIGWISYLHYFPSSAKVLLVMKQIMYNTIQLVCLTN